jgi:hypothetical protein
MNKIGKHTLHHVITSEEPQCCLRMGCEEDNNGLNHYWIDFGDGISLSTWLCDDCVKIFNAKLKEEDGSNIKNKR